MTPEHTDVERVAAALWRAETVDAGVPTSVTNARTLEAFADLDPDHRERFHKFARAAIAAMQPSVAQAAKVLSQAELPSYVVEMPITASGNGPATVGFDAARMTYEVWDAATLNTIGDPHSRLSDANRAWLRALSKEIDDA